MTIRELCESFDINGKYVNCLELGTGNINSTYLVKYVRDDVERQFILQRINKNVFKEPEKVMDNIVRVTNYVREKVEQCKLSTKKLVMRAFLSKADGKPFVIDDNGEYWRCYRFIPNSITYDTVTDLSIVEGAGTAFGRFQNYLHGFDAQSLYTTIPDFHNTSVRYQAFEKAIKDDPLSRVKRVENEIEKLMSFKQKACLLQDYLDKGELPIRVTHNDTKCNNVSFDKDTGEALAVLDLDTVMPGAVAHDFGDAIRFIANSLIEDDTDVENVSLVIEKYEAFTKGFITQVKQSLTELEKATMNLGVFAMTVELAVRFLTDYLLGDTYFKTKHPGHNVDRARNQIALAEDVLRKSARLDEIIKKYY
ncbi:MAG: aminoglycoside phosphotransferase family protein [Clostridia bacterium]|nr:aminoglycoside phosphotransferase family protein [Clostridia bacterium]